jgi:hypothetical protein
MHTEPEAPSASKKRIASAIAEYQSLPDSAVIRPQVAARIAGCSEASIWRLLRTGTLTRVKVAARITGIRCGELRALLAGNQ